MKAFVITTVDIPQAVKSANKCIATAKRFSIKVEMVKAFTPKDNPRELMLRRGLPLANFGNKWCRFDNALSCFLSHFNLWCHCTYQNENFLIFEHDAVVTRYINITAPFVGLLSFGKPSYGTWKTPGYLGVNNLISKEYFPGAHAYLIKPWAAERLIKQAKIDACPTDVFLHNDRFPFLEEYYPWPVEVQETFTTVQKLEGCYAKHNYRDNPKKYEII